MVMARTYSLHLNTNICRQRFRESFKTFFIILVHKVPEHEKDIFTNVYSIKFIYTT